MKFGQRLSQLVKSQDYPSSYFHYKRIKKGVKRMAELRPGSGARERAFAEVLCAIEQEVHKVNECTERMRLELDWIDGTLPISDDPGFSRLSEYAAINATALRKAVKKLDKHLTEEERSGIMRTKFKPLAIIDPSHTSTGEASVGGIMRALVDPNIGERVEMETIGSGGNAKVLLLGNKINAIHRAPTSEEHAQCCNLASRKMVGAAQVAIKDGNWSSRANFEAEVSTQERAALAGVAPEIFFCRWLGANPRLGSRSSAGRGIIGMERLSQPSFFQWLRWLTIERRRELAARPKVGWRALASVNEEETWLIDPIVMKQPIVLLWRKEAKRLQAELRQLRIAHGDIHDMNFVFHVPEHELTDAEVGANATEMPALVGASSNPGQALTREKTGEAIPCKGLKNPLADTQTAGNSALSMMNPAPSAEHVALLRAKARKHKLMDAIAKGPGGPARLYVVDFGCARILRGRISWLVHDLVGGGQRLADASKLKLSPRTPGR
mmetsp:Transcript_30574/g.93577  ORF Transcript_30574/g.93577 Transcript_30574/m.93577 type:complete len:496 (-) Transcript_30574:658-2145(-)